MDLIGYRRFVSRLAGEPGYLAHAIGLPAWAVSYLLTCSELSALRLLACRCPRPDHPDDRDEIARYAGIDPALLARFLAVALD